MRRTAAGPQNQRAACPLRGELPQMLIRNKKNRPLQRKPAHQRNRIAAGAAVVAEGLHLGRRVHITNNQSIRMLPPQFFELPGRNHIGHRAAGGNIRQQNRLLRRKNRRRFRHKKNTAEDNHIRFGFGRLNTQTQRIADKISNILNRARLIIMSQDHRIPLLLPKKNLFLNRIHCSSGV